MVDRVLGSFSELHLNLDPEKFPDLDHRNVLVFQLSILSMVRKIVEKEVPILEAIPGLETGEDHKLSELVTNIDALEKAIKLQLEKQIS